MHDDRVLVEKRIERELWQRVLPNMYRERRPLRVEAWTAPGEPVTYDEAVRQRFEPCEIGTAWGRAWGTTWFRLTGDVPDSWSGAEIEAVIDLGFGSRHAGFQAEGLVWLDGVPLQGVHPRRQGVPLRGSAGAIELLVEGAANPMLGTAFRPTPLGSLATVGEALLYRLVSADLAVLDPEVAGLCLDVEVLTGVMQALSLDDPRRHRLLRQLEHAFDTIDVDRVAATAPAARAVLAPALALPARASSLRVVGVGHAHIDTAWLWPLRETVRKCARTFSSAVRLMDEYPDYRFVCSQAVQYRWIEDRYPALFERIRCKVADGQFVPVGGMWVEADMNLPGGESLARQFVHGQRYFESRFGRRCTEVWIPDVFGYPASMPQLYRAAGCERFVTQKLSWNKQNRFPHNTFWWEGIDGSRVLTHFPPVDTYNAEVTGGEMAFSERNFRDHGWSEWALMPYGHGNGGGGPTREMVERARRMCDLDGAPRLELGTVEQFFDHLDDEVSAGARVPVWRGELYFEMHRGTLTSQIETKVGNRRCERLLREAELWWATVGDVPADVVAELDELWKDVLVQQFHDILPGSSIAWVHDDAEREHARITHRLEELIVDAFARLGVSNVIANATSVDRVEVVDVGGTPTVVAVPAFGMAPCATATGIDDEVVTTEHSMANGQLAVQWDLDGNIVSIIDVARGRELLPPGRAVEFELARDLPVEYDAWDVESWTHRHGVRVDGVGSVAFVERGPLRSCLEVRRRFGMAGGSTMSTRYVLCAGSPRLDIVIDVEWHEHEQLLSLMVPLDVRADEATCDIQFGTVRRPTHPSSPWDAAKFEVCAHRFVDLSEPGFGVAVLNNGRFGHGLFDGGIRVSLLRGARFPDPEADQGRHEVTVSIMPHGPGLHDVFHEAQSLEVPLRVVSSGRAVQAPSAVPAPPVVSVDHPGVQVSAVKRADDGSGDLVVRLYEACGDRSSVAVRLPGGVRAAQRCTLLEEPVESLDVADGFVSMPLRPYELVTVRLSP